MDVRIVQLIYNCKPYESIVKDFEFSRRTMEEHWRAGYNDAVRALGQRRNCTRSNYRASGEVHLLRCIRYSLSATIGNDDSVFRSLCGWFVTYCTSTMGASPALEATAPAARISCPLLNVECNAQLKRIGFQRLAMMSSALCLLRGNAVHRQC